MTDPGWRRSGPAAASQPEGGKSDMRGSLLWLVIFGILGFLIFLFWPRPIVVTPPPPPPPALADWGDAPDPDSGMDTGYYEPVASPANPLIMIYQNAGVAAQFPTDVTNHSREPRIIGLRDVSRRRIERVCS